MKIIYHNIRVMAMPLLLLVSMLFLIPQYGMSQKNNITISSTVTDANGIPVANAMVRVFNKGKVIHTDKDGLFKLEVNSDAVIYISANGFETQMYELSQSLPEKTITLAALTPFLLPEDQINIPFETIEKNRLTGAVSVVDGDELLSYPDLSMLNSLAGRVAGLYSTQNSSTPGWNSPTLVIRGLGGLGNNRPLILVDGFEREANALLPEEIESVEVLKDVTAKMLYGSKAADGVIVITTKRGKNNSRDANISMEYGIMAPTSDPQWLNAADYATLYNQARANDGLAPLYSDEAIAAYRNGSSPILYPNNDFNGMYLNNHMPMKRVATEFRGGGKSSAYYVNMGYTGTGGLEDIKEPTEYNKFNLRGNLDIDVSSVTSVKMDIAGRMEYRRSANITTQDFFGALSSHRPNEYPVFIPTDSLALLGGSYLHPNNIYGLGNETGYKKQENRNIQFNLGLHFNLNKYIEGLSAGVALSYDNENYYRYANVINFASYQLVPTYTDEEYNLVKLRQENHGSPDKLSEKDKSYNHRVGSTWNIDYSRTFNGSHDLNANLVLQQYQTQRYNQIQYDKFANYGLRINYAYKNKYVAELNTSLMGSSHFTGSNQFGLFPALGLAWIMSNEGFLADNANINYLKLKASGGVMGSDKGLGYFLYEDQYSQNGSVSFGPTNKNNRRVYQLDKYGNPNLTWEKRREFNVGIESILFNNTLSVELNYFNILDYDIITSPWANHPSYIGTNLYSVNNAEVINNGFEGDIIYYKNMGDFKLSAGVNFVYSKSEIKKSFELPYPAELQYLSGIGQAGDRIYGYVHNGFVTDSDIAAGYTSTLGTVKAGDIKYTDLNNDGVIDPKDQQAIGNWFPRLNMGMHINLQYKGFGLYALGVFQNGFDVMKNNRYFWNYGERKYSAEAISSDYVPLTTTNGNNNFTGSDYWLEDAGYFKLKNVELSYLLPDKLLPKLYMKKAKVFVRGTNLLTISQFDNLDAENIDAGINDFPLMKAITGGISVTF
ncbi:SusC/RagA family TonB-linked outer membrane protein [Carboxylicivirga mesophila]|uniref:SusC/RagA family TonB-linked outer membrane protein n=1 Tax=Carboxylicivirga mesophila TaxID=1166478 RepID=A0ABS5K6Y3_9BACT|nr:SusC/RagA family TonB-linked outer membrane protein [Carboxylicivirga mesophila]MBS2210293.1 SusC/RagA family TonB-linked outer membrane protein [Carboxylicivirga mesophila]